MDEHGVLCLSPPKYKLGYERSAKTLETHVNFEAWNCMKSLAAPLSCKIPLGTDSPKVSAESADQVAPSSFLQFVLNDIAQTFSIPA